MNSEQKQKFFEMRTAGATLEDIAATCGFSLSTAKRLNTQMKESISEQERQELAAFADSLGATKKARIKALGDSLAKVNQAIDLADFSKCDPVKLLDMQLKLNKQLAEERQSLETLRITSPEQIPVVLQQIAVMVHNGQMNSKAGQTVADLICKSDELQQKRYDRRTPFEF